MQDIDDVRAQLRVLEQQHQTLSDRLRTQLRALYLPQGDELRLVETPDTGDVVMLERIDKNRAFELFQYPVLRASNEQPGDLVFSADGIYSKRNKKRIKLEVQPPRKQST